jgi:hypothetical protein
MANFNSAFAAARKAGKKEFSWGGKSFNTKLKAEGTSKKVSLPKTAPVPTPKPMAAKATVKATARPVSATPAKAAVKATVNTISPRSAAQKQEFLASERKYKNDDLRTFRKK